MKNIFKKIVVKIITWQAKLILKRYKPKIIAVTGSVGKTSTKDAIFTVLSKCKSVRKSEKSFNSEIGLPLTILGVPNGWSNPFIWLENIFLGCKLIIWKHEYPSILVLEVGTGKPGDIKSISSWLEPDIVVITRFPDHPVHVEFFGTSEKVIEDKTSLALALKADGVLILNHDDEKVYAVHRKVKCKTVSFGLNELATYRASYETLLYKKHNDIEIPDGIAFKLEYNGNVFPVILHNVIGIHFISSALAAIACATEIGCDILSSTSAISEYRVPAGRSSLIEGVNDSIIIDDTYNASPVAMESAVNTLASVKGKRRIAVLGDMLELGKITEEAHRKIGESIVEVADILIVVGPRAKFIADGARDSGFSKKEIYEFDSAITCGKFLQGIIDKGDIILVKGSQGVRLERAVEAIMAHPEDASKLLCRQEKEWKNR